MAEARLVAWPQLSDIVSVSLDRVSAQDEVLAARQRVLNQAYAANPDRFVNGPPIVEGLPTEVWINPPEDRSRSEIELQ